MASRISSLQPALLEKMSGTGFDGGFERGDRT
jgi:hypothetical protein